MTDPTPPMPEGLDAVLVPLDAVGTSGAARCPKCDCSLKWVGSGPGWMNSEQWDASKAGEYYLGEGSCPHGKACVGKPNSNGNRYFDEIVPAAPPLASATATADLERERDDWKRLHDEEQARAERLVNDHTAATHKVGALTEQVADLERRLAYQKRADDWLLACFGEEIARDVMERNNRFIEEALELVQALGMPREDAHSLVEYVYDRPAGDVTQEVGGVLNTLAALCLASGIDMLAAGETELARVWTKVDVIRAKQAAKPRGSALPVYVPPSDAESRLAALTERNAALEAGIVAALEHAAYGPGDHPILPIKVAEAFDMLHVLSSPSQRSSGEVGT